MTRHSGEDYEPLEVHPRVDGRAFWQAWQAESAELNALILKERGGQLIDMDALLDEIRTDRELRDESIIGQLDSQD